jgi:hypothetical protein
VSGNQTSQRKIGDGGHTVKPDANAALWYWHGR